MVGYRSVKLSLLTATALGMTAVYDTYVTDNPRWSTLRVVRFGRAALAALVVSVDYKLSLWNIDRQSLKYQEVLSQIHLRSALRLRKMCSKNGGMFVKVGQHVGSMEYLLPLEYVNTFKLFHSDAPHTPLHQLKKVIEKELKRPASEVFTYIEDEPLGAASLAQCHRGALLDGREVAIKIQHPNVRNNSSTDMDTMDFLVQCTEWLFPGIKFKWLAEEVRKNLPKELDFQQEAYNMEKVTAMFKHLSFLKVPRVCWDLTTPRLLVMEFCQGGKVDDLEYIRHHKIPVNEVSLKLGRLYSEMIFLQGFIHCDPHPGNVLVRNGKEGVEIVMLDHGLYQQLTNDFRITYCHLWQGLTRRDVGAIKRHCLALNAGQLYPLLACIITARSWNSIQHGISSTPRSEEENQVLRMEAVNYFSDITRLLATIPRQLLLILKTNDLLRSIEHVLGSSAHSQSFLTMTSFCVKAIAEYEKRQSKSWLERTRIHASMHAHLLMIKAYSVWLWCQYWLLPLVTTRLATILLYGAMSEG